MGDQPNAPVHNQATRDHVARMGSALICLSYWQLQRSGHGLVLRYLCRFTESKPARFLFSRCPCIPDNDVNRYSDERSLRGPLRQIPLLLGLRHGYGKYNVDMSDARMLLNWQCEQSASIAGRVEVLNGSDAMSLTWPNR